MTHFSWSHCPSWVSSMINKGSVADAQMTQSQQFMTNVRSEWRVGGDHICASYQRMSVVCLHLKAQTSLQWPGYLLFCWGLCGKFLLLHCPSAPGLSNRRPKNTQIQIITVPQKSYISVKFRYLLWHIHWVATLLGPVQSNAIQYNSSNKCVYY